MDMGLGWRRCQATPYARRPDFVMKSPSPGLQLIPQGHRADGDPSPSGHRKSNHFPNSLADTEGRLISSPRGLCHPPGGQVAQLCKNLGHFALCHKALPRALASSALAGQDHRHTGSWLAPYSCDVEVPLVSCGLGQAAPGYMKGRWMVVSYFLVPSGAKGSFMVLSHSLLTNEFLFFAWQPKQCLQKISESRINSSYQA